MSFLDGFLDAVNLRDDDEDYDEEEFEEEEEDEPSRFKKKKRAKDTEDKKASNVTPIRSHQSGSKRAAYSIPTEMAVVVIKPTSFNDIQEIADTLLSNRTVVLNTEGLDMNVAERIIDFMFGTCYAVGGRFQKISNFIFIITPKGVKISGDLAQMVDDLSDSIHKSDSDSNTFGSNF